MRPADPHADPRAEPAAEPRADRYGVMLLAVALLVIAVAAGAVALWPRDRPARPAGNGTDPARIVDAVVTKATPRPCQADERQQALPGSTCSKVEARLTSGRTVKFDFTDQSGGVIEVGRRVKLSVLEQEGQPPFYSIVDLERDRPMLLLAAIFVAAVLAFGRWQGVRSLIGLAGSFVVIVGFIVPAILDGRSPVAVALVGGLAIMVGSLYLSHGLTRKTTAAVVGTALALGLTGGLALAFVEASSLTGLASEEALNANFQVGGLSLRGLLLAGIIIGGLGVLDDVTMSQASLVFELRRTDPSAPFSRVVRSALTVGRDHIAATVNTLFLAYAGASLPLLILFATSGESLRSVATSEVVAVEIVRTLCGSIGLIAAVPLTTVLAVALAGERPADTLEDELEDEPALADPPAPRPGAAADPAGASWPGDASWPGAAGAPYGGAGTTGRRAYGAAPGLGAEGNRRLWLLAIEALGPSLSHATARAGGTGATHQLDLGQPRQLEALQRHGWSSPHTLVYAQGDPEPVMEVAPDPLERRLRLTLRLRADELERMEVDLPRFGLPAGALAPASTRQPL